MTTTTAPAPATDKQVAFIQALAAERKVPEMFDETVKSILAGTRPTKSLASSTIDALLHSPRVKPSASPALAAFMSAVTDVPDGRYALPDGEISDLVHAHASGDLLFVRLRTYKKHRFIDKLVGAPGAFARVKLTLDDQTTIAGILATNPLRYAQLFGEHYRCCSRCLAELTDETSRLYSIGPVCRRYYGIME